MHDSESTTSQQHQVWVDRIDRFKAWFESELALLGDASLTAENTATVQTLAQIADLEREEIKGMEEAAERAKLKTKASAAYPKVAKLTLVTCFPWGERLNQV